MEAVIGYACHVLGGLFRSRVDPVAAALDTVPDPAALEDERCGAAERAAAIRAQLAMMCTGDAGSPPSQVDVLAAYVATKGLLYDLWRAVAADAKEWSAAQGPAAASYVRDAFRRAAPPPEEGLIP